ncbi:hypothetical protein EZV62_024062 [Acer yangbiense]|uniref:hAT-like transposase RNase-H fold domain-containing protein n=1 Tax=Acer yangbiense TaxID=1000413 RepID=A0A5C7H3J6_9ROSI|nr:hypothetical protein EZV62_024062 [Acer yangbiense]
MLKATKTKEGDVEIRTFKFDQDTTRRELANMVILNDHPLSLVEYSGFHRFMGTAQSLFKIPSRYTLKSDILQIYDYERAKLKGLLEKNKGKIALTTDMWTSHNQRKGFMAITSHFVDNSWTLQSRIIRFIYVPCLHTSEMLADAMMECLHDWNIEHKLSTLTVDNCSTNNGMIRILLEILSNVSLLLNGDMFHMHCYAHILNLIVKDGLDVIMDSFERIRSSVSYWTSSPKREENFFETVNQLEIKSTKKLVLADCKTRWNSTYLIIHSALMYKTVFAHLKHKDSHYKNVPTEDDWVLAKEISDKFDVFYQATEEFLGTKYPTANNYLPTICDIRDAVDGWSTSTFEQIKLMASSMAHKFDSNWRKIHGIMVVATILDPRYKMKIMECYFPSLYGDGSSYEIIKIQEVLLRMVEEYKQNSKVSQALSSNRTHVSPSQSTMGPLKKNVSI